MKGAETGMGVEVTENQNTSCENKRSLLIFKKKNDEVGGKGCYGPPQFQRAKDPAILLFFSIVV